MPTTFRVVAQTQIQENYGAHCWNGEGECPQYWKFKGGNEYQVVIGDANDVLALGSDGIAAIVDKIAAKVERNDEYFREYVIGHSVVPSTEETPEEKELRESLDEGYCSEEQYKHYVSQLVLVLPE